MRRTVQPEKWLPVLSIVCQME